MRTKPHTTNRNPAEPRITRDDRRAQRTMKRAFAFMASV